MAKVKYYYDTETCRYERVKTPVSAVIVNALGFLGAAFAVAIGLVLIYGELYDSPEEARLRNENKTLQYNYETMSEELMRMEDVLVALQDRDEKIYRVITEADPLPRGVRQAGVGGSKSYQDLLANEGAGVLIAEKQAQLDALKRQLYIQSKSYDEISRLAQNKEKMLRSIPAISPVNKKQCTVVSGFGWRTHPIYKVKKLHTGLDFAAQRGTPIYATGDGVVIKAEKSYKGYGNQVEVDHGFGYVTKYAHMQRFIVNPGERIKRGQLIGYVGSTGASVGPHLHYEVIRNGTKVNPVHYLFGDLTPEEYEEVLRQASIENQSMS